MVVFQQGVEFVQQVVVIVFDQVGGFFELFFGIVQVGQCCCVGDCFDMVYVGSYVIFVGDFEQVDVVSVGYVGVIVQFDGEIVVYVQYVYLVVVFFVEQCYGVFGFGGVDIGFFGFDFGVVMDFGVDDIFQGFQLFCFDCFEVVEVEMQVLVVYQ